MIEFAEQEVRDLLGLMKSFDISDKTIDKMILKLKSFGYIKKSALEEAREYGEIMRNYINIDGHGVQVQKLKDLYEKAIDEIKEPNG